MITMDYEEAKFWLLMVAVIAVFVGTIIYVLVKLFQGKGDEIKLPDAPQLVQLLINNNRDTILWTWKALEDGVLTNEEKIKLKELWKGNLNNVIETLVTVYGADKGMVSELIGSLEAPTVPEPASTDEIRNEEPPSE